MVGRPPPAELVGPLILPSVMSADPLHLGDQVDALLAAGARVVHVDVMDAHFVPNLTLGTGTAEALAGPVRAAGGLLDVHLMVARPGDVIPLFAPHAGMISIHVEADPHPHELLGQIRAAGCRAGLAVNPGTPAGAVSELVEVLDYVNCMSVNPGFAGQRFIPTTPAKLARLRALLPPRVLLEVDGGIDVETALLARAAGADLLVSASAIFGAPDPVAAYRALVACVTA